MSNKEIDYLLNTLSKRKLGLKNYPFLVLFMLNKKPYSLKMGNMVTEKSIIE